jgi:hypothetical protein
MKDGFNDITNDFELKLDETTLSFLEKKFRNIENLKSSQPQQQPNNTSQNTGTILIILKSEMSSNICFDLIVSYEYNLRGSRPHVEINEDNGIKAIQQLH